MRRLLVALLIAAPLSLGWAAEDHTPAPIEVVGAVDHTQAWRDHLAHQRAAQVERLMAYADAGVFPQNTTKPGLLSQLVDAFGNPCAMAHLVISSGQGDLVARLARKDNGLQFGDVTAGPLHEWILTSGLTQEEAAYVQAPDFYIDHEQDEELLQLMVDAEIDRLRSHFHAAAAQIAVNTDDSLDLAVERLGDRVLRPPPAQVQVVDAR